MNEQSSKSEASVHAGVGAPGSRVAACEKAGIAAAAAAYMAGFHHTLPHGDALRVVRQIDASELIWNPNHLLFDPLGYGAYRLFTALGTGLTALESFQILSAVTALVSLLLFHSVLVRAGVSGTVSRLTGVLGLFATTCFLALAGGQYFMMIQMPFLVGALYLYVDFADCSDAKRARRDLVGIGVLLAIAAAIMFSNVLLAGAVGLAVGFARRSWTFIWRNTLTLWIAAAVVGFPLFVGGYLLGDAQSSFPSWLLSYQGESDSNLNNVYGLKLTLSSIVEATAMVGYNFAIGNMVEPAGLATVISETAKGRDLEFIPQWPQIALALVVVPLVLAFHVMVVVQVLRKVWTEPAVRFLVAWLAAILLFAFLWKQGDEIFWVQLVPATWLLFYMSRGLTPRLVLDAPPVAPGSKRGAWLVAACVLALFAVNTRTTVMPLASRGYEARQAEHSAMVRAGDLELIPGWDTKKWTIIPDGMNARQLLFMNMAVARPGSENALDRLPAAVAAHLDAGGRVIVGRLYDKDDDLMPWYGMAALGWPRAKIQALLAGYCTRPVATIAGTTFRELYRCAAGETPTS